MSEIFEGLVRVERLASQGMITLRGDLASGPVIDAAFAATGLPMPALREARSTGARALLWMSPDELAVLVPHGEAAKTAATMAEALKDQHALVTDVSDARAHFVLHGRALREVIAKLAPVDMAPEAMPVGMVRRTRFAQVAAGFWLRDEVTAQVFGFRSVADYMEKLLQVAADPHAEVGYF